MTLEVSWKVQETDRTRTEKAIVSDPADIERLLVALGKDAASDALIYHQQRPRHESPAGPMPDHDMSAAASRGWGYLSFVDVDHGLSSLFGEAGSPEYHGEHCHHPAGSGVRLDSLRDALIEFLNTSQRPTCVRWLE